MKINLNLPVLDLNGKPVILGKKEINLGQTIAEALVSTSKGPAVKCLDWAIKLQNKEVLDLDTEDQDTFRGLIESSEVITNLAKGQALKVLLSSKK